MSALEIAGFVIAVLPILIGGFISAVAKKAFHAALGLGVALVGVAGLFITMGYAFIGMIQILVYVGGILTLLVFAIMFVIGDEEATA